MQLQDDLKASLVLAMAYKYQYEFSNFSQPWETEKEIWIPNQQPEVI